MNRAIRAAGFLALLIISACARTVVLKYDPIVRGIEDPTSEVALKVVDGREPEHGGTNTAEVGRVRGGYGNPFPLFDTDPHKVSQLVRDATTDALSHARVSVQPGSPRVLVATVKTFWLDGYVGYKAAVDVECQLQDLQGTVLWTATIGGAAGGTAGWSLTGFVASTYQTALANYAENALVQFNTPAFQKNVF